MSYVEDAGNVAPEEQVQDIYIRFNEDNEKDYAFTVRASQKVSTLYRIFEVLPLSLRPSVFYEHQPTGFAISRQPGFLTTGGALLLHERAHEEQWIEAVSDDDRIGEIAWDSQLFVPIWKENKLRKYTIAFLFLLWLYTDLPDMVSPTPGYQLTTQLVRVSYYLGDLLGVKFPEDDGSLDAPVWAWGFFVFHILKCLTLYLVLWSGTMNPLSLNPFKARKMGAEGTRNLNQEVLQSIGWTGARRVADDVWRKEYREWVISSSGGIIAANDKGKLKELKEAGVWLEAGEGFSVKKQGYSKPVSNITVSDDLTEMAPQYGITIEEDIENPTTAPAPDKNTLAVLEPSEAIQALDAYYENKFITKIPPSDLWFATLSAPTLQEMEEQEDQQKAGEILKKFLQRGPLFSDLTPLVRLRERWVTKGFVHRLKQPMGDKKNQ
ncbi:Glucose-signaling factor 2 [Yarrowia sp. C11]|nr:Glucose-signaling factor 2 [Yarrowia sp. E02]KAG5369114.1 Glucose-signaling factor 2 [Yarrowia sp. C11]